MSKCIKGTKRSRNDLVKSTVGSYLRRRHYIDSTETFKKSQLILSQTCKEMAIDAAIEKDVSRPNSIMYSSVNTDAAQSEQQFNKFQVWITEIKDEACRIELSNLLLPVFCHMYLDLLRIGHRLVNPINSIKESLRYMTEDQIHVQLIEELSSISNVQDIEMSTLARTFRSGKYQVKLSSKTIALLKKYLANSSTLILLQVFQTWFELETLADGSALQEDDDDDDLSSSQNEYLDLEDNSLSSFEAEFKDTLAADTDEKKLKLLEDAIQTVRNSPPVPNPMLVYTVQNLENVCCSSVYRSIKLLATGNLSSEVRLWNLSETKLAPSRTVHIPLGCDVQPLVHTQQETRYAILRGHCGPVCDVAFLSEAEVLLSASHDTTMRAWRIGDYSCASVYRGHNYPVWCLAVSPLGMHIATGSQDKTARIWNLDRTYPLRILAGHTGDVNCVRFHPNNCYIASGSVDKSIRLWCVKSGNLVRVFAGHTGSIQALAFSPNGKFIASGGEGGRIKIWDLAGGGVVANLKGNSSRVAALDWSKCGSTVASAACNGTVQMWDVDEALKSSQSDSGIKEPLCAYNTGCSSLLSLQFSVRNTCIVVGTNS